VKLSYWALALDAMILVAAVATLIQLGRKYRPFLDGPYFES
jgi:hypothetical protein